MVIYLDNAATTKVNSEVLDTFNKVHETFFGNPHSLHTLGVRAESLLEQSRSQILTLLKAEKYRCIFTSGATEANNLAIRGLLARYKHRGKHIITSMGEHPSVLSTIMSMKDEGYEVTTLSIEESGTIKLDELKDALCEDTILVSLMAVNNELGSITPIEEAGTIIKEKSEAFFHVDAVQSIGNLPLSLKESTIDMLSFSSHKFHGLKGSGALLVKNRINLVAQITGGDQESGLRSGTVDVPSAACLAKALRLATERMETALPRLENLRERTYSGVNELPGITFNSNKEGSPFIYNFSAKGIQPETLLHGLAEKEIYISTISACSSRSAKESRPVFELTKSRERATTSVRISLSTYTQVSDIEEFLRALKSVLKKIR